MNGNATSFGQIEQLLQALVTRAFSDRYLL
jgi:hypothetical protein